MKNADKADIQLIEQLLSKLGLSLERYPKSITRKKKSPDGIIKKGSQELALIEIKSLHPTQAEEFMKCLSKISEHILLTDVRNDSFLNKISRHVLSAAEQFTSIDPQHSLPHILAIICYDDGLGPNDFFECITGYLPTIEAGLQLTSPASAHRVLPARSHIDGYVWIKPPSKTNLKIKYWIESNNSGHKEVVDTLLSSIKARNIQ